MERSVKNPRNSRKICNVLFCFLLTQYSQTELISRSLTHAHLFFLIFLFPKVKHVISENSGANYVVQGT